MRKISILLVCLVALLSLAGIAAAQDAPPTFCGTLAQSDCDILTQSAAAMRDLGSAGFQFHLDFNFDNIPDYSAGSVAMRLEGRGAYSLDRDSLSPMLLSPETLMENLDQLPQLMEDAIRAISADTTLLMFFPDSMRAAMSEEGTELPQKAGLSMKMVDGMAYLNLDKFAALAQDADMPKGWFGFDLAGYYRQMLENQAGSLSGSDFNFGELSQFNNMDFLKDYVTLERVEDATVGGESVAVFKTTLDMGALVSSDVIEDWIRQQAEASGTTITATDMKQVSTMLNTMFRDFTFEMTQSIGQTDFYVRDVSLDLDWSLDVSAIASAFGDTSSSQADPINIGIHFQAGLDQFNAVEAITAPEDAIIIPLDRLNNFSNMVPDLPQT